MIRVGLVGYGALGKFIAEHISKDSNFELVFVWNRTMDKLAEDAIVKDVIHLTQLEHVVDHEVDVIVEVAHPTISEKYADLFLSHADYFIGSPTAFASTCLDAVLDKCKANAYPHGLYIPSGALWGAQDIKKMADSGKLCGLTVTMKKHPNSFRVSGEVSDKLEANRETQGQTVLYQGPLRRLCPMAPNNVNTMACAALASANALGFDKVNAVLISDPSLEAHIVEVEAVGPTNSNGDTFTVKTVRYNPADKNAVTGSATYHSFVSSLKLVGGHGKGIHFC